jgi:hypothetical protein
MAASTRSDFLHSSSGRGKCASWTPQQHLRIPSPMMHRAWVSVTAKTCCRFPAQQEKC